MLLEKHPGISVRVRDLFLFDFDGVLCDSLDVSLSVVNELAGPWRFRRVDDPDRLRDLSSRELIKWLGISWWKLPFVLRAARRRMLERQSELRPFDGALETLAELREQGVAVGIVTSNSRTLVWRMIGTVDHLACDLSLFGKSRALKKLARGYDRVVYFGDETRDLEAARKAGVLSAAVTWGYTAEARLREADFVCRSWTDVLGLRTET